MELLARKTLADCEAAHKLLKAEKRESETWRVHWFACLALLRAVGHVLKNADGESNEKLRAAVKAKWDEWTGDKNANAIFWDFIEEERNNLLKEYKFGVQPEPVHVVAGGKQVVASGKPVVTGDEFFRMSREGFEGKEGRDVIAEAIEWWRKQLADIEK